MPILNLLPRRVLIVVAHADDAEFWIGGTIAKWIALGVEIYLLVLTAGDKGTDDPSQSPAQIAAIRRTEQLAAAAALGIPAAHVHFGGFEDGRLRANQEAAEIAITRVIRHVRPDTVIGWAPDFKYSARFTVNHKDHRAAGDATIDAVCPSARDASAFPDEPDLGEPHIVANLLLIHPEHPDRLVSDITEYVDVKLAALGAHISQATGLANGKTDLDRLHELGRPYGIQVAEAFVPVALLG